MDRFRRCHLSNPACQELQWWASLSQVSKSLVPLLPSTMVSTDASCRGWGATWGHHSVSGLWYPGGSDHINILELRAILLAIKHWAPQLRGYMVSIHTVNRTAISYILREGGTRSPKLMSLTRELSLFSDKWNIVLRPCYLPGIANAEADALSWNKQIVEWCLLPDIAANLFRRWGRPEIDLFASANNVLLPASFPSIATTSRP